MSAVPSIRRCRRVGQIVTARDRRPLASPIMVHWQGGFTVLLLTLTWPYTSLSYSVNGRRCQVNSRQVFLDTCRFGGPTRAYRWEAPSAWGAPRERWSGEGGPTPGL